MTKITAVGGYEAVGRNMTSVTVGKETVAIDNGIRLDTMQMYDSDTQALKKYSNEDLLRMDIFPDISRLKNVIAQIISHGHLDHIGALPITEPKSPIITTHYSAEIGKREYPDGDFYSLGYGESFEISPHISVEFIEITHSIPYTSVVVLHTNEGDIVYASDFKLDDYSGIAKTDYNKLREIGKGNVKALIVESTRAGEIGKTPSESVAKEKLKDVVNSIEGGLIVATTFSTHIERVQAILDEAEKTGRIPVILGRSLFKHTELAEKFGLMDLPLTTRVFATPKAIRRAFKDMKNRDDYFLLVTGHQGEATSVLSKMIKGGYPFKFEKNDSVILCANAIPTPMNIASRYIVETKLRSFGVRVFDDVHVSGHASKEDHRRMLRMIKPDHIIPCHGGITMRGNYTALAVEEGYELNKNIHLLTNGLSIEI